jgi:hypothetical protein
LKIQTFIIVHSVQLIIDNYEKYSQYCPNITWLLVSIKDHNTALLDELNINYIECQKISGNIEHKPNLLHDTAYHIIYNNNLIDVDTDYVHLVEYDLEFDTTFVQHRDRLLALKKEIYCHIECPYTHCWVKPRYLNNTNDIVLQKHFKSSLSLLHRKIRHNKWMVSMNFFMTPDHFRKQYEFSLTFLPYADNDIQFPNNAERRFTIYCLMNNITWGVVPGIKHIFRNSHGLS